MVRLVFQARYCSHISGVPHLLEYVQLAILLELQVAAKSVAMDKLL